MKNKLNLGTVLGSIGVIAGVLLMIGGNWFVGLFGSIASAGLIYHGYRDYKNQKTE